jgi:hypothetical protein
MAALDYHMISSLVGNCVVWPGPSPLGMSNSALLRGTAVFNCE